jgi:hypothetical protein
MDIRSFFSNKQRSIAASKHHNGANCNKRTKIKSVKICNKGVDYLVTTNADIEDETTWRFIDSLVSSEESSDEELCEEKESHQRILKACTIVSNEITQLNLLLNSRLEKF